MILGCTEKCASEEVSFLEVQVDSNVDAMIVAPFSVHRFYLVMKGQQLCKNEITVLTISVCCSRLAAAQILRSPYTHQWRRRRGNKTYLSERSHRSPVSPLKSVDALASAP